MSWLLQNSEALRNIALIVGGSVGVWLAWLRVTAANRQADAQTRQAESAVRQTETGHRKLVGDLFSQAVGQLRDDKLEIRLFSIYTLRRIAADDPDDRHAVIELLAAYVRALPTPSDPNAELPIDVEEIMKIISDRSE
jgi:hypothetical protein